MADSSLSFISTSTFRDALMAKNLAPYTVQGVFTPPFGNINYETNLSNLNVINSPDELIANDPFAQQLYPLNQYGPPGGYDLNINYNNPAQPINPNQGIYDINDADIDLVNEFYIDAAYIENVYGPEGGFNDLYVVDSIQNNNRLYLPYWEPPSFAPSSYTPYEILLSDNPVGDNGSLSQDSFIAKIGAQTLRSLFRDRINAEIYQNTVGLVNLESLSDPFEASLILTGQEPLVYRNWRITIPENPILAAADFITRLGGAYFPVSPIPGDYFQENELNGGSSTQISNALNVVNQLTGGFLGPILNKTRNPSEIFLANTGNGQRSALFANINYNRYQPGYQKNFGGLLGVAQGVLNLAVSLINPDNGSLEGGYYVGSRNAEPSTIDSPPNQLPVDPYGRQIQTSVYGPTELANVYEGNDTQLRFGLAGKPFSNGGGIDGQFVWVSPKYKDAAGYKATVGGGTGSLDQEFNLISGQYLENQSTNLTLKQGSILDDTQRLVDSADNVSGVARLKHVGNAINQVSKVFNDGYKELTKGSRVVSYVDNTTGAEAGIEYCRVFTKDTPYYTYADLQKTDGITTSGRRFVNSVFDNTYNLNIAPLRNPGSTNILPNAKGDLHAKKYMFSIENLAWRTSSRPGFTYDDLPVCEKGPNGGRVMWFPPYDIKFSDSSSSSFNSTTFLGRPEPIYTYKETSRSGTLSWKIIVDHPSVMNTIVEKQLKGVAQERIDSIIDSFFAGCVKFDIYELAKKFNTIPISQLYTYQQILNNPRLTEEELININKEIPRSNETSDESTGVQINNDNKATNNNLTADEFAKKYNELAFYFFNDIPDPKTSRITSTVPFQTTYSEYTSLSFIKKFVDKTNAIYPDNASYCKKNPEYCKKAKNAQGFYDNVIIPNFTKAQEFITDAYNILSEQNGTITVTMIGSASAPAEVDYNVNLSKRRIDSVKQFFSGYTVGGINLSKFYNEGKIIIKEVPKGEIEDVVVPSSVYGEGFAVNCHENIKNGDGNVDKNGGQTYSVNAMSCRRVKIKDIVIPPTPSGKTEDNIPVKNDPVVIPQEIPVPRPKPTVDVIKKLKEGISKQILRNLFSECDYFDIIKEEVPMVYNAFKEKIRYFNPAFHSMTPEGLNARLNFLNQCVRPGETIPTIGTDGQPKYNDAVNTSFGAPPILVLRIGDFFHTKIVPDGVSFSYEPITFDMNPEGIGIQPMIVNVSMNFKIIGGMGLAKPVEQLQNALSFNYYANTEIYDERAVPTEDTSALDKQVVDAILAGQVAATVNNVPDQQINDAGNTIGDIITNIPVPSGQTGEITYQRLMDSLLTETRNYFQLIMNKMETINNKYNYGIVQMLDINRKYNLYKIGDTTIEIEIYGKPTDWESELKKQFDIVKQNNTNQKNPIIVYLNSFFGNDINATPLREVVQNMNEYLDNLSQSFNNDIAIAIQEIVEFEQNYVYLINKLNLIYDKIDGKILENNLPRVYNLSGTTDVNQNSANDQGVLPPNTYEEFTEDYKRIQFAINSEFNILVSDNLYFLSEIKNYQSDPLGCTFKTIDDKNINAPEDKNFFLIMSRILTDKNKKDEFINFVLKGSIANYNSPVSLRNKFEKAVENLQNIYLKELEKEKKSFDTIKNSSKYKGVTDGITDIMYPFGKLRKFTYTTVPDQNEAAQKQKIIDLYRTKVIFN